MPDRAARDSEAAASIFIASSCSTAVRALVLCVLIVLPMSWLVYYSFTDKNGAFTLQNFVTLVTDPTFLDPLVTTFILATSARA